MVQGGPCRKERRENPEGGSRGQSQTEAEAPPPQVGKVRSDSGPIWKSVGRLGDGNLRESRQNTPIRPFN